METWRACFKSNAVSGSHRDLGSERDWVRWVACLPSWLGAALALTTDRAVVNAGSGAMNKSERFHELGKQ